MMKMRFVSAAVLAASLMSGTAIAAQPYVSLLGGPSFSPDLRVNNARLPMDTGFNAGARLGMPIADTGLSLEADLFYNQSHYTGTQARIGSLSYMGNLIYRVDTDSPYGFYGGAGIGAIRTEVNGNRIDGTSTVLGWQAIGGLDYQWTPEATLFAEYRYQESHNVNLRTANPVGNRSNNVSVGVKFGL